MKAPKWRSSDFLISERRRKKIYMTFVGGYIETAKETSSRMDMMEVSLKVKENTTGFLQAAINLPSSPASPLWFRLTLNLKLKLTWLLSRMYPRTSIALVFTQRRLRNLVHHLHHVFELLLRLSFYTIESHNPFFASYSNCWSSVKIHTLSPGTKR